MRVVSPYRPFPAESAEHQNLGAFDWVGALEMLRASVAKSCDCETVALTDEHTDLPGASFRYPTRQRHLMLWILEVAHQYLDSPEFDRDTVMVCPDLLVFQDLRPWFAGDFGIVVRPGYPRPILNSVQWWPVAKKDAVRNIYRRAIKIAHGLDAETIVWGADSEPFRQLFGPIEAGLRVRRGWLVNLVDHAEVMEALNEGQIAALDAGLPVEAKKTVVDFRYLRKRHMRAFYNATVAA